MSEAPESRLLIDGKLTDAQSGKTFANVNPATEEVVGQVADGGVEDMDAAIAAARRAFDETDWSTDRAFRKTALQQLVDALDRHKDDLRPHIVAEVGCPIMLTYAVQLDSCVTDMQWDIDMLDRMEWEYDLPVHEFMGMRSSRRVFREPVGVVGAITPWNFPFMLNVSKLGPALAAGNTVVLKPAPDTPWSATMIGKIIAEETDIPAGVVNIVASGDKAAVGEVLTGDPRVDMISFTGSTGVGKRIMARGAETVKKVFLELGGKSANIILDDADLDGAAMGGMMICIHGGQGCAITTRMLLPESRYDEGVEKLAGAFSMVPYGDPMDMSNIMGPLVNAAQYEKVLGMIERAKADGAKCLVGGGPAEQFDKGYFVQPTLFVDVDPESELAQDEVFGPVLAVIKYKDDDDAVRIANNSRYGLSGAVSSASLDRALGVAKRIRTGTVSVNGGGWFGPDSPFGGYKESGVGREHGVAGFEEYLETKTVGLPAD
ncbi:MAG: aldehyde dehydrogenase family protein [Actinobacteria bacterium]|nr:aldehyde dehydrogenase family protein [Actinomycetota bacterium]